MLKKLSFIILLLCLPLFADEPDSSGTERESFFEFCHKISISKEFFVSRHSKPFLSAYLTEPPESERVEHYIDSVKVTDFMKLYEIEDTLDFAIITDSTFTSEDFFNRNKITLELHCKQCGDYYEYTFELIDNKWYATGGLYAGD